MAASRTTQTAPTSFTTGYERYHDRMPFKATDEMIASAEQQLGRRLPQAHRERLRRANGGDIKGNGEFWTLFPAWDPTDRRTVARTTNHIVRENETLRNESPDAFWDRYIAIASDGGGNLLVIDAEGDVVYDWDHETGQLSPAEVVWAVAT